MFKIAKLFFMHVQTPLHAGSGRDLGLVDLPIQRERHTGFPKVEGSGIKGSIREIFEELYVEDRKADDDSGKKAINLAFGPEDGDKHAGSLGFTDARILLFPVKSMKGVFAYITCPSVIERFRRDLELCFKDGKIPFTLPGTCKENTVSSAKLIIQDNNIILEEYAFPVTKDTKTEELANVLSTHCGLPEIQDKLVILSDDDFRDFVNLSTEVITRTKIDSNTGTVAQGQLFTEEYLPAESILYSLALASPLFYEKNKKSEALADLKTAVVNGLLKNKKGGTVQNDNTGEKLVMKFFEDGLPEVIQVGGNATLGKGIVRTSIMNGTEKGWAK